MVSGLESKIYCLLAGKILPCATGLSHQKSKCMFDFWLDSVQMCRFFFFSATLHSQKIVKEIAYIPTSFQAPFKSAIFFVSFVKLKTKGEIKQTILASVLLFCTVTLIYKSYRGKLVYNNIQL